ncbi:MAG: hypothetical protein J4G01_07425 [Dehalococcoidia bacterium]|nr:hypothetical protein [Dehalococcoidia bacterium]
MTKEYGFRQALLPQPPDEFKRGRANGYEVPQHSYSQAEQGPVSGAGEIGADVYDVGRGQPMAMIGMLVSDAIVVGVLR